MEKYVTREEFERFYKYVIRQLRNMRLGTGLGSHQHVRSDITDFWITPFWDNIPDKPSTFPPSSHSHVVADITNHNKAVHDALGIDADTVDGYHLDQDVRTTASPTFAGITAGDIKIENKHIQGRNFFGIIGCIGSWGENPFFYPVLNSLAYIDKIYTVTVSEPFVCGSISNLFDFSLETSARWNTTSNLPATIEIDFGETTHYWKILGVYFVYTRYASYVKIEIYNTSTSTWQTLKEVNSNSKPNVYWTGGQSYVGKIRFTFDGVVNFDEIAIGGIYGYTSWSDISGQGHFLFKEGDTMYGDLTMALGTKMGLGVSPSYILHVQQNSPTDPIADAWTTYSTRNTKEIINEITNFSKILSEFKSIPIHRWKRRLTEPKPEDFENENEYKKALEEYQKKIQLKKFNIEKISAIAEEVPEFVKSYDEEGNLVGIDLLGYIGWLHAILKGIIQKIGV